MLSKTFTDSKMVEKVEYNEATELLIVQYKGGKRYSYSNVPREVYDQLVSATSTGTFISSIIKPNYTCQKL